MSDLTLDHVVIGVRDLDGATDDYRALLGREPSWRGSHTTYGTRNTLFRIDNTYVELLALGNWKAKDGRWAGELSRFLDKGEGLYALALGTPDVAATLKEVRALGLEVQDAADGAGDDELSGGRREWRNAMVPVKASHGVRVFFIEHGSPEGALPAAAMADDAAAGAHVKRMDHAVVLSADMETSKHFWGGTLGARLALDRTFPDRNTRILFFRLGDITIEISGGAQQTEEGINKPDRLWGLAWGVDDLDAMCARLRGEGVVVSEPRRGIKPGTRVASVKGEHAHGVATLLIEHSAESFTPEAREPQGESYDNAPEHRAFTATGLDHVTLTASDIDATAHTWESTLGLTTSETIEQQNGNLRLSRLHAGNAFVELAQPLSSRHSLVETIAQRGTGMYGMSITVDSIDNAIADLRAKGVTVSEPEYGAWPGTRIARVDASATNGVTLELVEHLPEML